MAWLDFLKSIRLDNEETRKRREQGGILNNIRVLADSNLDKIEPTVNKVADNKLVKYGVENAKNNVGVAAGLAREIAVKPITRLVMTQRDSNAGNTGLIKDYQELLKIPEAQREEEAKNPESNRGAFLSRFKEKYGNIDDQSIQKRLDELTSEENDPNRGVFKIKDDKLNRAIFGNEDIHSMQSDQRIGEAKTGVPALGVAYAGALAALDYPGTGPVKSGGKAVTGKVAKALADANTDDAVKQILKTGTKWGDKVIDEIAPRLAKITDKKQIQAVAKTASDVIKENIDKTKPVIDDYASFLKGIDDGATGGKLQPTADGGYVRTTEHSGFYSNFYKEKGRPPTKTAWREEAARQLENGKAETAFQDEYIKAGNRVTTSDVFDAQDAVKELASSGNLTAAKRLNETLDKYKLPEKEFASITPTNAVPETSYDQLIANDKKVIADSQSAIKENELLNKQVGNEVGNMGPLDAATEAAAARQVDMDKTKLGQQQFAADSLETAAMKQPEAKIAMADLTNRAAQAPLQPGFTRVYQLNPVKGEPSEWVFDTPEALAKFADGKKGADNVVDFVDVPKTDLIPSTGGRGEAGVFRIASRMPDQTPLADGVGYTPGTKIDLQTGAVNEPTNQIDSLLNAAAPVTDNTTNAAIDGARTVDGGTPPAGAGGGGTPPPTPPAGAATSGNAEQEILGLIKSGKEIDKMGKTRFRDKAYQQFFDKLDPIKKMVTDITKKTGEKLKTEDNPYELMRLYASMPQKVKQKTNEFVSTLDSVKKAGATLDDVRVLGLSRRVAGRPDKSFAITQDQARSAMAQLEQRLGSKKFAVVNKAVDDIVAYNDGLVEMLVDSGVMSRKAVDAMHNANPDYFARMQAVNKLLEKGDAAFRNGRTFNLSSQKVIKEMKGMKAGTEILDPVESIIKATELTMRTAHRNRVFNSMMKLSELDPETVVKIADPEDVAVKISLNMENAEIRPVRDKLLKMSKSRASTIKKLQSEINKLNKKGLHISLKTGEGSGTTVDNVPFSPAGLGGKAPTSKARNKIGPKDTATFVRNLVEGPNKDLVKIKKMIGNRDPKLASLMDEFIGIKAEYEDAAATVRANAEKVKSLADADVPDGYKVISGYGKGFKGRLAIPEELADVYAGLTQKEMDLMTGFIGSINQIMKTSVTTLSLPFAFIRNPIRDFKAMASNSQNIPPKFRSITKAWISGFAHAAKQDDMYKKWVESGGGGSGLYDDLGDPTKLVKKITKDINKKSVGQVVTSPKELAKAITLALPRAVGKGVRGVQKAGATLEAAPRIAEFEAALKKGTTNEGAAMAARDVTVDFHQSGTVGQLMNYWVPFLNARLQGNKKLYEAAKRDPKRFMKMYTGLTVAPMLATAGLNARYPEVMAQIDEQTRDNNFVIILGDEKNDKGDFTQIVKIPKGDIDKILGNPLENFVNFAMGQDSKAFGEVFLNSVASAAPVDFVKDGKVNVSRAAGGVLPVGLKVPIENATNHSFYYDTPIVPDSMSNLPVSEQKRDSTSAIDQLLGAATFQSPLKAQAIRTGLTGSLFSAAPTDGLSNAVVGAGSKRPVNEFYNMSKKVTKDKNEMNSQINKAIANNDMATAKALSNEYNSRMIESLIPWYKRYGQYLSEEDKQTLSAKIDGLMINLSKQSVTRRTESIASKRAKAL